MGCWPLMSLSAATGSIGCECQYPPLHKPLVLLPPIDTQRNGQCPIQPRQRGAFQRTDIVRQRWLRNTHQIVTVNAGFLLQPFRDPNGNLRAQTIVLGVDRSANDRREGRIDQRLTAHHHKDALLPGIARSRLSYQIEIAPLHRNCWYSSVSCASWFRRAA